MNAKQTYSVILLVLTAVFGFAQSPDHMVVNPNNKVKVDFKTIDVKKNPKAQNGNQSPTTLLSPTTRSAECVIEIPEIGECMYYECIDCDGICDHMTGICTEYFPDVDGTLDSSGKTNGAFGVSPSGGATYNVPISLPPGIKDIAPSLSISYNSQSGNGLAGWGWNVGGLSVISRIPSTTFHDGSIDGIDLSQNDRFALDGQRLILQSGTHGYSGSTYQTEHFSNIKIEAEGNSSSGPTRFIVTYPDGTRAWYGGDYGNAKGVLEWALREVEDPQGNSVIYSYHLENNLLRIDEIKYGSQSGYGPNRIKFSYEDRTRPEVSYINGTEFKRTKILKQIKVYVDNQPFRKYTLIHDTTALGYQRLVGIQEYNEEQEYFPIVEFAYDTTQDGLARDGNSLDLTSSYNSNTKSRVVGDFDGDQKIDFLTYDKSTKNQLEIFTDLYSGEDLNFGYTVNTESFDNVFTNTTLSWNGKVLSQQGITTVRETLTSGASQSQVRFRTFAMASYGPVFQYDVVWNAPTREVEYSCSSSSTFKRDKQYVSGDFNGDGLTDVLAIQKPYNESYCYNSPCDDDDGIYYPEERRRPTEPLCCECYSSYINSSPVTFIDLRRDLTSGFTSSAGNLINSLGSSDQLYAVDFNGDGKTDLMHIREGSVRVYSLNAANNLTTIAYHSNSNLTTDMPVYIGDFNGDGKTDFVQPYGQNSSLWYYYFSKGNGVASHSSYTGITFKFSTSQDEYHFVVQDFNGDGKSDILKQRIYIQRIGRGSTSVRRDDIDLYINKHSPNSNVPTFDHMTSSSSTDNDIGFDGSPIFLEKNTANNILEYAYVSGTNVHTYEFQLDHKKDVTLNKITNNGEETEITYESLGVPEGYDSSYSYDYDELYPYININIARSLKVVTEAKRNSSGAPEQQQLYRYKGAVSHAQGLGFMGFKTLRRSNWFGDNVGVLWTISKHDPQKRGAAFQQWVSTSSYETAPNEFASKTTTTYATQTLDNKVFINLPTTILYEDGLQGISSTETYTYDSYNNPLTTTTSFAGGTKTLTYEYFNNPSGQDQNYHIGRPKKVLETNTLGDSSLTTETEFLYTNNLLSEKKVRGTNTPWLTESFGYDEWGNITQKTISGEGIEDRTEEFDYDASGRFLTNHFDILGLETVYTYDTAKGTVSTVTDPYGLVTSSTYDSWQRLKTQTDYLGNETVYTYNREYSYHLGGFVFTVFVDYPQGQDHINYYNAFGWKRQTKVKTLNDQWLYQQFEHDAAGRVTRESEPFIHEYSHSYDFPIPSQWNQTYYDHYGRPVLHDLYNGKDISTTYDGLSVTVDDGTKTVTTTNDALGNIATLQDPGGTVNYLYHANGTMKSANYGTHSVTVEIDNWGRKTSLNDPSAGTYTYDYNILGEVLEETTPKGSTTYTYDEYGRLDTKTMTGDETDMTLSYTYGSDELLYRIEGYNNREDANTSYYTNSYSYDEYKRVRVYWEYNNSTYFARFNFYDDYGRVSSYRRNTRPPKGSLGISLLSVEAKNVYDSNGIHTEIRDNETDDLLWRINEENARGQALNITLGNGITKARTYDDYGFLTNITDKDHSTAVEALKMDYDFNAQRGILNSRTNHGFANWTEHFTHDNLDRLTEISGATTHSKTYDERGRITQNAAVGDFHYASTNIYQLADIDLNTQGDLYYQQRNVQNITYNAHKKPIEIHEEGKGRVSFEYSPLMKRAHAYYGGEQTDKNERRFHKSYAINLPTEFIRDRQNDSTKIITYLGGDAYTAPIAHIFTQNSDGDIEKEYHYLHRDYLGSILAITDSEGNVVEERQFGAWGTTDQFSDEAGNTDFSNDSLLDRGFTGHEHFFEVSLIHMNGRLYDPQLGRFLSPDNYVQDPYNTQSFNRYGYVWNNPLVAADPSGEFISILIGAIIGVVVNGINNSINGEAFFKGWEKAALMGAISGAVAFGIGELAQGVTGTFLSVGSVNVSNAALFQFVMHGYTGGFMSVMQGGEFGSGFLGGAFGSAFGGKVGKWLKNARDFPKFIGTTIAGGISGGVGSRLAGGKFWDGFRNGAIAAGLNHGLHELSKVNSERLKARILKDGKLTLKEANRWFRHGNGEGLTVDASKVDLDFINLDDYPLDVPKGVQTLGRSKDGLVYGNITIKNIGNGQLNILPDEYDFRMHSGTSVKTKFRNFATKIGHFVAGNGTPYNIEFSGINTPNYRRHIPR